MPRPKLIDPTYIRLRLTPQDYLRLQRQAAAHRITLTAAARQAVTEWLDMTEEDLFAQKMARDRQLHDASTNRICSLLAKVAIDTRTSMIFLLEQNGAAELMKACRADAIKQITKTMTPAERQVMDGLSQFIKGPNAV